MRTNQGGGFTSDDVAEHVRRQIGPIETVLYNVGADDLRINVAHVRATPQRPFEVVVTSGMSSVPMVVPDGAPELAYAEVLAPLPRGWPMTQPDWRDERAYWPIRLLRTLARYPHRHATWLGFGHTVGNGDAEFGAQPYAAGVGFCAALLMPPLTLGRVAWVLRPGDGRQCCFWAVVPLHAAELRFKARHGIDALLARFDQQQVFDRIDPERPSAVCRRERRWLSPMGCLCRLAPRGRALYGIERRTRRSADHAWRRSYAIRRS